MRPSKARVEMSPKTYTVNCMSENMWKHWDMRPLGFQRFDHFLEVPGLGLFEYCPSESEGAAVYGCLYKGLRAYPTVACGFVGSAVVPDCTPLNLQELGCAAGQGTSSTNLFQQWLKLEFTLLSYVL